MSKSVKKEILASEYSSEQVLAVNTRVYVSQKCLSQGRLSEGRVTEGFAVS